MTLDDAKRQLGLPLDETTHDYLVAQKLNQAEAHVRQWCNDIDEADWDDAQTPDIEAAIVIVMTELFRFRGDDQAGYGPSRREGEYLSPTVLALLLPYHKPVMG